MSEESAEIFDQIRKQCKNIQSEVYALDKNKQIRTKVFKDCLTQYTKYIKRENELLDSTKRHNQQRNEWCRDQMNLAWSNGTYNRHLVLKSVARTNVLKKDISEWLQRIDENYMLDKEGSFVSVSVNKGEENMQGSKLMDKYNDILLEYMHKV